ncbi:hypothetical protein GT022_18620 [Agaribacter marinus]|uniref:Uncharacterized protein n=2 Tax=Virgibacillus salarius TaxID=447199 RepID=A0A941ID52_9BACI|nr:hypothetical protein [Virgibacillus salarius]MBR7798047.1 hypothetical protein [Virgibacillus salarius]NAZ10756.1 hypothetical protein [Agaribacter marinus]WBX80421.1 hypothetical protein PD280_00550 [Virgibacillus salarius]
MIEEIKTFEATKATNTFNRFIFEHHLRFGWVPYDNHHKVTDITYSLNGSGYSVNNEENFERMFHFSLTDLEIAH